MPATRPMMLEKPMESTMYTSVIVIVTGVRDEMSHAMPVAASSPSARADGLANADLLRPLGDGDEHDVHHADAADEQADGRNRNRD